MDYQIRQAPEGQNRDAGPIEAALSPETKKPEPPPGTIYDDSFRKMAQYYPELFLTLINEVFHRRFAKDETIRAVRSEYYSDNGKFITDVVFEVAAQRFHFECQSWPDGTMLIRMLEYGFSVALDRMRMDGTDVLEFPDGAVVYLRHTRNTPERFSVTLRNSSGDAMPLYFHCVKVQNYSEDDMIRRHLFLFLPFYAMRYEKDWERMEQDGQQKRAFLNRFSELVQRFQEAASSNAMRQDLLQMTQDITFHLLRRHESIRKDVETMMTDRLGTLPSEPVREEFARKFAELRGQLREKDAVIGEMSSALGEKDAVIGEKDATIAALRALLVAAGIDAN